MSGLLPPSPVRWRGLRGGLGAFVGAGSGFVRPPPPRGGGGGGTLSPGCPGRAPPQAAGRWGFCGGGPQAAPRSGRGGCPPFRLVAPVFGWLRPRRRRPRRAPGAGGSPSALAPPSRCRARIMPAPGLLRARARRRRCRWGGLWCARPRASGGLFGWLRLRGVFLCPHSGGAGGASAALPNSNR